MHQCFMLSQHKHTRTFALMYTLRNKGSKGVLAEGSSHSRVFTSQNPKNFEEMKEGSSRVLCKTKGSTTSPFWKKKMFKGY